MATGKRASMREGPLADLFRKTADDATSGDEDVPEVAPVKRRPARAAAAPKPGATEETSREPPAPSARRPLPHPAFDSPAPREEPEERYVPSQKERLRQAFSADIPEDILQQPTSPSAPPRDVYARAERPGDAFPAPHEVGQPVLRVVGVGGAGVNAVNRMVEAEV